MQYKNNENKNTSFDRIQTPAFFSLFARHFSCTLKIQVQPSKRYSFFSLHQSRHYLTYISQELKPNIHPNPYLKPTYMYDITIFYYNTEPQPQPNIPINKQTSHISSSQRGQSVHIFT